MPKSSMQTTLPGRAKTLPGWGSAWKKPWAKICLRVSSAPRAASTRGSRPAARRAAGSVTGMTSTYSRVSTRRVVKGR